MTLRWLVAAIHLMALGIGLGAVWARGRALRGTLDLAGLRRAFYADAWWGIAALIWIVTGIARAFGGLEKGGTYYLHNHFFWGKMALFATIFILEMAPMTAFMGWRSIVARGEHPNTSRARTFANISFAQAVMVLLMVLAATAMARGRG